jgi:hypothetical protein
VMRTTFSDQSIIFQIRECISIRFSRGALPVDVWDQSMTRGIGVESESLSKYSYAGGRANREPLKRRRFHPATRLRIPKPAVESDRNLWESNVNDPAGRNSSRKPSFPGIIAKSGHHLSASNVRQAASLSLVHTTETPINWSLEDPRVSV